MYFRTIILVKFVCAVSDLMHVMVFGAVDISQQCSHTGQPAEERLETLNADIER